MDTIAPVTHDYFAELFVAGKFADAGWNVYFPHRDEGFDFVISKQVDGIPILRPVQVKGKYPTTEKSDKVVYGYVGKLTQTHPDMVLAIPYFPSSENANPVCVAYMPFSVVRPHARGFRCQPATYRDGLPQPRREFLKYFDNLGISRIELQGWSKEIVEP